MLDNKLAGKVNDCPEHLVKVICNYVNSGV